MALVIKDRTKETTTTTGTGTLTLAGATTGYQSFSTAIGNGNTTYYTISTPTGSEWEVGLGTVGAGTLARTSILASSNSGSAVNFSAGSKDVFGTYPAGRAVASTGALTSGRVTYATTDGAVTDSANFTFNGTTVTTANDASISGLTVGKGGGAVATNTAVGYQTLLSNTTGGSHTAIGYQAGYALTGNINNITAIGYQALRQSASTGAIQITAIGFQSLFSHTGSGFGLTAVGFQSLYSNTGGSQNTVVGTETMYYNTGGGNNTALGYRGLYNNVLGNFNTAIGHSALLNNTTAVATLGTITGGTGYTDGTYTGVVMTLSSGTAAGVYPTATIVVSGGAVTSVTLTAFGSRFVNITTVLTAPAASIGGTGSGFTVPVATLATGGNNTAVGFEALKANTTASSNAAFGYQSLLSNTTGNNNTALGFETLRANTTGADNTAIGHQSLRLNTTGGLNVAVGYALIANTTGTNNTSVGRASLGANTTGSYNTALGWAALNLSTGSNNVAIGAGAGQDITSGGTNTLLGTNAGNSGTNDLTTGSNNTIIGYNAAASSATVSNEVTIGNASITSLRVPGVGFTATTNGFGYATGSGGAVTQATSRTTGVTLNKTNGAITLVSAAGLATYQSFTVTNSTVATTDTIIVNQKSGTDKNIILVTNVAAGSFEITFATTGGTTTEQPVFNFAVIKAVTA